MKVSSLIIARRLEHLQQERLDGRVADELEEEQVFQALEPDGTERGQAEQQLGEAARLLGVRGSRVLLERGVHLLAQHLHLRHRLQPFSI